jgi:D-amino-acid dehydrogenase
MKILVLGAGVIGVTTAWHLQRLGHQVTVLDRQPAAAEETSHANAGQISPGYAAPWAAPGIPLKAIRWLLGRHSPLRIDPKPEWDKLQFMGRMLANCNPRAYAVNKDRMMRLAEYSRQALADLLAQTGIAFDHGRMGTLQLFRNRKQLRTAQADIALLERQGIPHELLTVQGCAAIEPALERVRHKLVGGLYLPLDQTGDCRAFTLQLAERCREQGVRFHHGVEVQALNVERGRLLGVDSSAGCLEADACVMALGSHSTALLRAVGIRSPVYPVKGYSITLPVTDPDAAPLSTLMDETYKVAITRLGDRIRVAGTAELAGYNLDLKPERRATLRHVVGDLFPRGFDADADDAFWSGLRPMTPDGTPLLGRSPVEGLWLNTGHGTLGWTMSCGSARLIADLISGRRPEIGHRDLSLDRYRQPPPDSGTSENPFIHASN